MSRKKRKQTPKRVLRLPDLDFAKSAVLNTLAVVGAAAVSTLNSPRVNRAHLNCVWKAGSMWRAQF